MYDYGLNMVGEWGDRESLEIHDGSGIEQPRNLYFQQFHCDSLGIQQFAGINCHRGRRNALHLVGWFDKSDRDSSRKKRLMTTPRRIVGWATLVVACFPLFNLAWEGWNQGGNSRPRPVVVSGGGSTWTDTNVVAYSALYEMQTMTPTNWILDTSSCTRDLCAQFGSLNYVTVGTNVNGRVESAVLWGATAAAVAFDPVLSGGTNYTIGTWIKMTNSAANNVWLAELYDGANNEMLLYWYHGSPGTNGSGWYYITYVNGYKGPKVYMAYDANWHFVATTVSNGTAWLYMDGTLSASATIDNVGAMTYTYLGYRTRTSDYGGGGYQGRTFFADHYMTPASLGAIMANTCPLSNIVVCSLPTYTNVTQVMTANNAPSPYVCSADSELDAAHATWYAFDKWASYFCGAVAAAPHWVMYDFGSGNEQAVRKFNLQGYPDYQPNAFKIMGSTDSNAWTQLFSGTHNNVTTNEGFSWANSTAYRWVMMSNTTQYGTAIAIRRMQFYR